MAEETYFQILEEVQTQIRAYVPLTGLGNWAAINPASIVIRRSPFNLSPPAEWGRDETKPGIIISPSRTLQVDQDGGNIGEDDVWYPVLLQIIDTDGDRADTNALRSWLAWGNRLRSYFSQQNLRNEVHEAGTYVNLSIMSDQDVLDERLWTISKFCVQALAVRFLSRESRNPNGTV